MEINEIVEKLKYYTEDLPKEALKEAIKNKEEITPKLLEMLEYTKNNLEKIYYEEDEFFGYTYAMFLLAEFKETRAFPYLIDLINRDEDENEDIVDYIIGDDYPEYLPRLLASTYNGDDKALFDIIENTDLNEFVRSSVLQTFAILYLNGIKDRDFIVSYFKKLLDDKKDEDNSYLYEVVFVETEHLRLIELDGIIDKIFNLIEDKEEIRELKDIFANENYKINKNLYPFKPCYEYIYDTIGIMEEWQCFRYREDEEYEGYDSLLNWLQDYDDLLEMCDEEDKLYERLELWHSVEEIFDLNNEINLYWKERTIREMSNTEFRLGHEEKATKIIEGYLNEKENWVWGYIEMADDTIDCYYNPEKDEIFLSNIGEDGDLTEDEINELFEESIILPTQYEINEYQMMEDFIETIENMDIKNNLQRLIQGKGAFRRFKDYCAEMDIIQDWYDFRDKKYKEIAIGWCKQNELEYK